MSALACTASRLIGARSRPRIPRAGHQMCQILASVICSFFLFEYSPSLKTRGPRRRNILAKQELKRGTSR